MFHGPAIGHGIFGVISAIVGFLGSLVLFAIIAGVLFFLIRFLIIGTKAAQLYIDKNRPAAPLVEPVETAPPTAASPVSTSSTSGATSSTNGATSSTNGAAPATSVKPAPKPRTPKTPPSPDI